MYPIELLIYTGGEAFMLGAVASVNRTWNKSSIETRYDSENIFIAMVARTKKLVQSRFFYFRKSEPKSGPDRSSHKKRSGPDFLL